MPNNKESEDLKEPGESGEQTKGQVGGQPSGQGTGTKQKEYDPDQPKITPGGTGNDFQGDPANSQDQGQWSPGSGPSER